jgi:pyroglutamyl-peptidase
VFYGLMQALEQSPQVKAGFIHIPYAPQQAARHPGSASMAISMVVTALKLVIEQSLLQQEDVLLCAGTLN